MGGSAAEMLATRRPGRLWARWGLARLGGVRTLASGAGEPFSSVHSSLSTAEQAEQPLSSLGTASPRSLLSPPPQCSEDGERPLLDALSDSSLAMAADRAEQELLRPQSAAGGWMEAREARRRAARIEQAEAPETRRLLLRGHVERWLGKMRLPSDPVMLRALSHGGGWISLEALCTQPKLRLLRASPEEVAEALDGSRVVEVERRLVPQSHRSHRRSATATRSVTTDRKGTDDSVTSSKEAVFVRPFGVTLEGMLSFLARDRREKRRELGSRICPITAGALPRYNPQATVIVSRTPDAIKAAVRRVCEAVDGEAAAPGGRAVGLVVYWPDGRQWPSMISMGTPGSVEVIRLDLHYVEAENEVVDACVGAHGGRECDAAARNTSHLRGDCGPWATGLPASLMDLLTGRDVVKVGFGIEGALSRLLDAQIQAQTRGEASAAAQIAGDVDVADGHEGKLASSSSRGSRRTSWWAMVVDFAEIERRGVLADLEENMASEGSTDVLRQADASIQCITNRRENDYIDDVKRGQGISGAGDTVIEQRASPWWMMERYLGQTAPDLSPSWLARQSETADDPDEPSWGHSEDEPRESSRRHVPYKAAQLEYDDGDGEVDQLRKRVQALYFTGKQVPMRHGVRVKGGDGGAPWILCPGLDRATWAHPPCPAATTQLFAGEIALTRDVHRLGDSRNPWCPSCNSRRPLFPIFSEAASGKGRRVDAASTRSARAG